ncbi:MAG: L-histidine N(alpha)-methyltransferase [Bacteroidota bacterium]
MDNSNVGTLSALALDVKTGLSTAPKRLSSRFFYDERGDKLFQEIMAMPEYYLTRCELQIFQQSAAAWIQSMPKEGFDLIELGAGDGTKTQVLLEEALAQKVNFIYRPIDISQHALDELEARLERELPDLPCAPLQGEYFAVLERIRGMQDRPKLILFLGSNIGNLSTGQATDFLQRLRACMNPQDKLLIGIDLKKDPRIILEAYNDPAGITAAFNLNLLHRINRELDADFKVEQFKHWETYNPYSGATKSFLVSTSQQTVHVGALACSFEFQAWETIQVELSQKYSLIEVEKLAQKAGFQIQQHYLDDRKYFVDSLWSFSA